MSHAQDTAVAELMEQLIAEGPDGMAQVFSEIERLNSIVDFVMAPVS